LGFSLIEVLLALGLLAIGMIFIAGVFPVAIHFSTIASERTIAAVVADEAFAKIRLYGVDRMSLDSGQIPFGGIDPNEFAYPSLYNADILQSKYCWSALCRRIEDFRLVQVTVFVCRKTGISARPVPVIVDVSQASLDNELLVADADADIINDDYTIIDNETGQLYRVLERSASRPDTIVLNRDWSGYTADKIWVIPSGGGRCIAVYQKVIGF